MGSTNKEIENYIKDNAPHIHFLGCFWNNNLPHVIPCGSSLIANYSSSDDMTGGTHWIAMINLKAENGSPSLFFDSFGEKPDMENNILDTNAHFRQYMKTHCNSYLSNPEEIQGEKATTCGHYCTLAVISQSIPISGRNHGTTWRDFCSKYTTPAENDKLIREIIQL